MGYYNFKYYYKDYSPQNNYNKVIDKQLDLNF